MNEITERKCMNCALCSFVCNSNKIECDVDNHIINNECEEGCKDNFVEAELEKSEMNQKEIHPTMVENSKRLKCPFFFFGQCFKGGGSALRSAKDLKRRRSDDKWNTHGVRQDF